MRSPARGRARVLARRPQQRQLPPLPAVRDPLALRGGLGIARRWLCRALRGAEALAPPDGQLAGVVAGRAPPQMPLRGRGVSSSAADGWRGVGYRELRRLGSRCGLDRLDLGPAGRCEVQHAQRVRQLHGGRTVQRPVSVYVASGAAHSDALPRS